MHINWKNERPYIFNNTHQLQSAEKRFNWRSLHLQPQAPPGLLLALILLRNVFLTSCLAENQLTSAAIAECRKTSGSRPSHLICSWTDKNYTLLVVQCDGFFSRVMCWIDTGWRGIPKMFSWPSHRDELISAHFLTWHPSEASYCLSSVISPRQTAPPFPCFENRHWTEGLRGKAAKILPSVQCVFHSR